MSAFFVVFASGLLECRVQAIGTEKLAAVLEEGSEVLFVALEGFPSLFFPPPSSPHAGVGIVGNARSCRVPDVDSLCRLRNR